MSGMDIAAAPARPTPSNPWRGVTADLVGLVAIGAVVVTVWMWVRGGGIQQTFVYPQFALESLALLTGLLASVLMIVQVLFLARIPWVEQSWGHDVLARRHKWLGYASFWLMIAHVLLFAIQRMQRAPDDELAALWAVFVTDPWMLWASIGTLMLVAVVVTSIQAARRRLRYESWHLIHLYAYLGMAFALPHQISDGIYFHQLWTRLFWWGMYVAALVATLLWRVAMPVWRSWRHAVRVERVVPETPTAFSVVMSGRRLERLRTRSGQFFIWRFLDGPGWMRGHPYSISRAPTDRSLRITLEAAGDGAARAARLAPGTRVLLEGPYGTMTADQRRCPRMLLLAAGVGITPLRGLLEDAVYAPGEATLIYRYSDEEHAIFLDELTDLAARRGIELILLPGPRRSDGSWLPDQLGSTGDDGSVLLALVPDVAARDVFVCGPVPWIRAVRRAARAAGVRHLHYEDYAW